MNLAAFGSPLGRSYGHESARPLSRSPRATLHTLTRSRELESFRGSWEIEVQYLRIYATSDGETHFCDVDLPTTNASLFPNEAPFELSGRYPATSVRFLRISLKKSASVRFGWKRAGLEMR